MFLNANIAFPASNGDELVGIDRSLSDLAVARTHRGRVVGTHPLAAPGRRS